MISRCLLRNLTGIIPRFHHLTMHQSSSSSSSTIDYETVVDETLESLTDAFETLLDKHKLPSDVTYSNGVLTIELDRFGTYVINKQTPNRQIWLSSPMSGPKRYDWINQAWIYKHDGTSLHRLLNNEISTIFKNDHNIRFDQCSYGRDPQDSAK